MVDPITRKEWNHNVYFFDSKTDSSKKGDVKYVMEFNKMYHLVFLAKAYYITKEEIYVKKIEQSLLGWISIVKHKRSVVNKIMLDKALRSINLLHVILLCIDSSYFNKEILHIIIDILSNEEKQIRTFSTPRWYKISTGANHTIGEMTGLITIQLFLQEFTDIKYNKELSKEIIYLNNSLENIISDKGVYLEQSAGYSRLVAEFLVLLDIFISIFDRNKETSNYNTKYLKLILKYINVLTFNNKLPNFGDNDGAKALYPFYSNQEIEVNFLNKYFYNKYHSEYNLSKVKEIICEKSGQFIWNTNNIFFHIRSGSHSYFPLGSSSHSHNDLLSMILSIKGNEFIIDKGTYLYNSGLQIRNRDRSTYSHNTVAFDKMEQAGFYGKWAYSNEPISKIKQVNYNVSKMFFEGNCIYGDYSHSRTVIYDSSKIDIYDKIKVKIKTPFSINFLFSPEFQITKIENYFMISNGKDISTIMYFDLMLDVEIVSDYYSVNYGEKKYTSKIIAKGVANSERKYLTSIIIK